MANRIIFPQVARAFDPNGDPASGAKAYFYESGTSTPATVYADEALTTPHPTPLVADSSGVFAPVYIGDAQALKLDATDADDVGLPGFPVDPIIGVPATATAAADVSFEPTPEIASTDVQAAIELVESLKLDLSSLAPVSNVNGSYIALGGSIQICWQTGFTTASAAAATWTYPRAFTSIPAVAHVTKFTSAPRNIAANPGTTTCDVYSWDTSGDDTVTPSVTLIAIGEYA